MSTRAPLTEAEKQRVYERKQAGVTLKQIAQELECAYETARKWWRHRREGTQPRPRGHPRMGELGSYSAAIRETAVTIKGTHPHWGPANVRLELREQLGLDEQELPSHSRLSALFKAQCPEAVQPRQQYHYRQKPPPVVKHPHQRWQIDAKEAVPIGDKDLVTVLTIRDPKAALVIRSQAVVATTECGWRKLTRQEAQDTLRLAFTEWGLPLEVQTDREDMYTGAPQCYFPSLFTLWLVGLGITHVVSRDKKPTDQSQIERTHRTLGDMVWKDRSPDTLAQLQLVLDNARHRYNTQLPVQAADCQGRPPLTVYPSATHSGRPFHPDCESLLFEMQRVDAYLAQFVWTRKVTIKGDVTVHKHRFRVGAPYIGQTVSVRFIPDGRMFRFQAKDGTVILEKPSLGLDKPDIIGRIPVDIPAPVFFQLPLPMEGV